MKLFITFSITTIAFFLVACGGPTQIQEVPAPRESEIGIATPQPLQPGQVGNYALGYVLPAVTTIYSVTGTVLAAPGSLSQYQYQSTISGSSYRGSGYISGSASGSTNGKGFVRFKVSKISWIDPYLRGDENWKPLVIKDETVLLKTEDSKASALGEGDVVTFLCREDQEFVAAAAINEIPTTQSLTRELDNCRMLTPKFVPGGGQ